MSILEKHNGTTIADQLIKFDVEGDALLVVSNQNNDATPYSANLCILRSTQGTADSDYLEMVPQIELGNDNNYQVITAGSYALKVVTAADIIVAVHV